MRNLIVTFSAVFLMLGCGLGNWPAKYDDFFSRDMDDRVTEIAAYPLDDQIQLHLYSSCSLEPPHHLLAPRIARQRGMALVKILATRPLERDPCRAAAVVTLYDALRKEGYQNTGLEIRLDQAASQMKPGPFRDKAKRILQGR